ncbi:MAG: FG-GAP-like repeat-containing protein [Rhodopirellula sp. JB055]|uniref:FG-GAP-like repeat-containing protein n=1 Tax=Rhodopirellula sp. JB055 TaxID=3342846 RepID=UPI00370B8854
MRVLGRTGKWEEAWNLRDAVLDQHSDDPDAITYVARVAYQTGRANLAADYLEQACQVENYGSPKRVDETLIAMISAGRTHDAMAFLAKVVNAHPDRHETRRVLFDLQMGTEERSAGLVNGQRLIRERQFDLELLMTMTDTEIRSMDAKPLDEMVERNPDDLRPLIGAARSALDQNLFDEAHESLDKIVARHPDYATAAAMRALLLAEQADWKELESSLPLMPADVTLRRHFWTAMGMWAEATGNHEAAAKAHWKATQTDPDISRSWLDLQRVLQSEPSLDVDASVVQAIGNRAKQLNRFNQLRRRFDRSGRISRSVISEMVSVVRELGRAWEAEAWISVGMQLPEDDSVDLKGLRRDLVASLRRDTPWQEVQNHPELQLDLSDFHFQPSLERFLQRQIAEQDASTEAPKSSTTAAKTDDASSDPSQPIELVNEAQKRGISFLAATGQDLDQPGISLHQTLGCGGATLDFDLDGWSDLTLVTAGGTPPHKDSPPNVLLRNENGVFVTAPESAGVNDRGFAQGIAVGDLNEDGWPDLLCTNYGPNVLLINQGDGTFLDQTATWIDDPDETRWSTGAAFADLDSDGLTDMVVLNYCEGLDPITFVCGDGTDEPARSCSPMRFRGDQDQFFRTRPHGGIQDVTQAWDALATDAGRGLGVAIGRFEDRPGNQVFIANDMTSNFYWSPSPNETNSDWSESALPRGLAVDGRSVAQGSMGIAVDDFNRDGKIDFYVTNFDQEYNTLHLQTGPGSWRDSTMAVNLGTDTLPLVGFGTTSTDLDGDGRNELIVANGHVDIFERDDLSEEPAPSTARRSLYAQPMQIFRHGSDGRFETAPLSGEYLSQPHVGRSLWTIDANRDLRPDLMVTHQTEPAALLINHITSKSPKLKLRVAGTQSSRDAIGTRITVMAGDWRMTHWVVAGGSYLSTDEAAWTLSCPDSADDVTVEIRWPNDQPQTFQGIATNSEWLMVQGQPNAIQLP